MSEDKQHYIIEDIPFKTRGIYVEILWYGLPAYERKKDISEADVFKVGGVVFHPIPVLMKDETVKNKRYMIKKISKKEAFIHLL